MRKEKLKVSIIMPAYNEEKRIGKTLDEFGKFFTGLKKGKRGGDFEILVVLNNCKDHTLNVVKEKQKKYKEILFLDFEQGGKGFAITKGFKDALKRKNDLIGFVDADLATSPESFFDLILKSKNYDGVIASRAMRDSKVNFTFKRKLTHKGFNFVVRMFLFLPYSDTQCGAKIFKRKVLEKIVDKIGTTKWAYDIDLLYQIKINKFRIKEIPTVWIDKEGGSISINIIRTTIQMFLAVVRLRLIYSPFKHILKIYGRLPKKLQNILLK